MKLVRIIDEDGTEQTFLAQVIINFLRINKDITGLILDYPLNTSYTAYMNDDELIDKIYGEPDDTENDYEIIDCRPPHIKNAPEVVGFDFTEDGEKEINTAFGKFKYTVRKKNKDDDRNAE